MSITSEKETSNFKNKKSNFIIRLFRGDITLPITYWVFGFGSALVFRLGNFLIENNFIDIIRYNHGFTLIKTYNILTIFIGIFMSIAIWRSASKYEKSPEWALVAKAIVIFRMVMVLITLYNLYFMDTQTALKNEIITTNKSLPVMVDEKTRFDKMSLDNRNIHYHYTMIDIDKSEIDLNYFIVQMHTLLAKASCSDEEMLELLKDDRKLIFDYNDKNNEIVRDISIELYDCN